ncbi:MAG TPA: SCP2 sterol-binding domain-containing protein [Candidatus Hydrogenedentes bacterium]|nr:SCP2 sterol-binding domain-containing protein [Candidatus Hydrogenedentota bacterium]HOV75125.1 SCP2 sterol-binding domain-containing protein [Candidatus Hydrogenedentota bacterium]HPC17387.1 SCP2 sterol-binding domain-containing protein [Candidatus Hydrogenedentota bacterium]HRT20814.1 SCP2 sterol-binding domain-containing protein [Candidatus Hydrogenedentota bacterium]HRT66105.1 SCP2 sterol-binding domain-containing protein [Candidatus Hydrogenedentota bacterium]
MADSFEGFFAELPNKIDKGKLGAMNATFQFVATGDGGGEKYVKIAGGDVEIGDGKADNPTITLTAAAADWMALMNGQMNGQTAFITGKLKIQGDMTLAMKLESIFQLG